MSDIDVVREMFVQAGVVFAEEVIFDRQVSLVVRAKDGPNNIGYSGFYAELVFTADGALDSVGAWE